jgi:hypothetical protein
MSWTARPVGLAEKGYRCELHAPPGADAEMHLTDAAGDTIVVCKACLRRVATVAIIKEVN